MHGRYGYECTSIAPIQPNLLLSIDLRRHNCFFLCTVGVHQFRRKRCWRFRGKDGEEKPHGRGGGPQR